MPSRLRTDLRQSGKTSKVYKTALFVSGEDGTKVLGLAADDQRTSAMGRQVADFFLGTFLGCKPRLPAAQLTHQFVTAANDSINKDVTDPHRRGDYQVALLSELRNNADDINPQAFADTHPRASDRQAFLDRVQDAGIDIQRSFPKDTTRVQIDKFRVAFSSGMLLVGPPDALRNNVEMPSHPSAQYPVELRDSVDSIISGR